MTTEDNYNASIKKGLQKNALGYTKSYAQALSAQANKRNAISQQTRANVLATIDELNQYLLGNVTLEAATDAARELTHQLNDSW